MKNLLLAFSLMTSISAFASTGPQTEEMKAVLYHPGVQSYIFDIVGIHAEHKVYFSGITEDEQACDGALFFRLNFDVKNRTTGAENNCYRIARYGTCKAPNSYSMGEGSKTVTFINDLVCDF